MYCDDHERDDVIKHHQIYLHKLEILQSTHIPPPSCSTGQTQDLKWYIRKTSGEKPFTFKQVGVPDKELLKNLYIFIEEYEENKMPNGIENSRQNITLSTNN